MLISQLLIESRRSWKQINHKSVFSAQEILSIDSLSNFVSACTSLISELAIDLNLELSSLRKQFGPHEKPIEKSGMELSTF